MDNSEGIYLHKARMRGTTLPMEKDQKQQETQQEQLKAEQGQAVQQVAGSPGQGRAPQQEQPGQGQAVQQVAGSPGQGQAVQQIAEPLEQGQAAQQVHAKKQGRTLALPVSSREGYVWLLIIIGIAILALQAYGVLQFLSPEWIMVILILGIVALTVFGVYHTVNSRRLKRELAQQSRQRSSVTLAGEALTEEENAAQALSNEQVRFTAVIEERQRLARDLHDAVSQQLFAISMTATALSRTIDKDGENAKRKVQLIEQMASAAQSEMRALLLHLRPVHLDGKNFIQALYGLINEMKDKVNMKFYLEIDDTIVLPMETEEHLFRICQEALSNALRHSKATVMEITFRRLAAGQVELSIADNGVGFMRAGQKQGSYGLLTMEERVAELGGTMELETAPGEGVRIAIFLAVPDGV
jgi:NarL family two-component system sensor histidine kinase LiaS